MVAGFVAAAAFSIIYRVPQREVVRCGLVGAGGWLVFSTATGG